jgi:hypothetical protein
MHPVSHTMLEPPKHGKDAQHRIFAWYLGMKGEWLEMEKELTPQLGH